jgi:hypothetical protein
VIAVLQLQKCNLRLHNCNVANDEKEDYSGSMERTEIPKSPRNAVDSVRGPASSLTKTPKVKIQDLTLRYVELGKGGSM